MRLSRRQDRALQGTRRRATGQRPANGGARGSLLRERLGWGVADAVRESGFLGAQAVRRLAAGVIAVLAAGLRYFTLAATALPALGEELAYRLGPHAEAARDAARVALRAVTTTVTPERAVAFVVVSAAGLLAASQFIDYRGVGIGVSAYQGVEQVAPAPLADRETAGSAHGYVLLVAAALAVVAVPFAVWGRWQLGRAISLLGAAGILVSLLVDMPKGLQEGADAIRYEGVQARLVEGFYAQLAASAVLLLTGLLLARYARLSRRRLGDRRRARSRRRHERSPETRTAGVRA